jgi:hypothetical protein
MPPVISPIHFPWVAIVTTPWGGSDSHQPAVAEYAETPVTPPPFLDQPTVVIGPHWEAIEEIASKMPGLEPLQRERLADAYRSTEYFGSLKQLYTSKAVEHLFLFAPHLDVSETASTRSLYEDIAGALQDGNEKRRRARLHGILRTMEEGPEVDRTSFDAVAALARAGFDAETIASRLVGTSHTAFLSEPRIANGLVSLLTKNAAYLDPQNERRRLSRSVLLEEIHLRIDAGEPLAEQALRELLTRTGFTVPESVAILIKSGQDFDAKVTAWGMAVGGESPHGCRNTLFRRVNGKGEIWLRDIEAASRNEKAREWVNRLVAVPHETAHALQPDFEDRVVSEVLAGLVEQGWRMRNYDIDAWVLAARLRMNIVQYLKLMALWAYRIGG